jgi:hypothetical protein
VVELIEKVGFGKGKCLVQSVQKCAVDTGQWEGDFRVRRRAE